MEAVKIFEFGLGKADGDSSMKNLLGGKGANLAEMSKLGLPIPQGVTIPTDACVKYMSATGSEKTLVVHDYAKAVNAWLAAQEPFLVSVRSGARVSMPGMMDTILNVGIDGTNLGVWQSLLGERAALDCFRRLIQMYGEVVNELPKELFTDALAGIKGSGADSGMSVEQLTKVVEKFLYIYTQYTGEKFPSAEKQIAGAVEAVFKSWNSARAVAYRNANNIPHTWGTAVTVQRMVYGNLNDKSATGVLFTRNPKTGEKGLYGEFLVNAQGEDVVAGIRTPLELKALNEWNAEAHGLLTLLALKMEAHYRDMQDMEFTIENGTLWILQTRSGKRSAAAAFKIAYDMVGEGLIKKAEAVKRVSAKQYSVLQRPQIDPNFTVKPTVVGIPASAGIVSGVAVFSPEAAMTAKVPTILVRKETTPDDFQGMLAAKGILTTTGGATSHAAVVARGMDKACVVGAQELVLGITIKEGQTVSIDGATGRVWVDVEVPVISIKIENHVREIIGWAVGDKTFVYRVTPKFKAGADHLWGGLDWDGDPSTYLFDGKLYIDTTGLNYGASTKYTMSKLIRQLEDRPGASGVIALDEPGAIKADSDFLNFLGVGAPKSDATVLAAKVGILLKKWSKKVKGRWVLKLPQDATVETRQALRDAGWKLAMVVNSLGELMEVDGIAEFTTMFENRMAHEKVKVEQLIALLKDAGRSVDTMPDSVTKEQMIYSVLGK